MYIVADCEKTVCKRDSEEVLAHLNKLGYRYNQTNSEIGRDTRFSSLYLYSVIANIAYYRFCGGNEQLARLLEATHLLDSFNPLYKESCTAMFDAAINCASVYLSAYQLLFASQNADMSMDDFISSLDDCLRLRGITILRRTNEVVIKANGTEARGVRALDKNGNMVYQNYQPVLPMLLIATSVRDLLQTNRAEDVCRYLMELAFGCYTELSATAFEYASELADALYMYIGMGGLTSVQPVIGYTAMYELAC